MEGMDNKPYTFNRRPIYLVFHHDFQNPGDAIEVEKQIQNGLGRKKKHLLKVTTNYFIC
jgi:predicted GIY-YIG superfamily endonuclease